jgi:predicted unusual protein kinase regulating ubiquinone biosynthesis (AarF/ABC1/UbiB family)
MNDFPSSKYQRGKIFTKTGLKVGVNYAKHYLNSLRKDNRSELSALHTNTAKDIFKEFSTLRGTALKIAQSMSIDQGLLPDEFTEVMAQAQYSAPPINRSLVRSIFKRELGNYPESIFAEFDTQAIAAASIGQVHRTVLKDGTKAAVKIQYPGVRDTISSDLSLARALFRRLISNDENLDEYIDEVRETLLEETDYIHEGKAIDRFHARFTDDFVVTPQWIPEFSTGRVLCMTFVEGKHLSEFLESNPSQEEKNHYGQLLWDFFHKQIENPEEIHADTHPGNFLLTPDNKLGVIDFGCVKTFPEEFFNAYLELLPTHLARDESKIIELYKRLGVLKADPDESKKEKEIYEFCLNYGTTFAMPYTDDTFDFGNPEYRELLRAFTKNAPFTNEARGSKHFIYSTRVHLGLYHLLMKLGAEINVKKSKDVIAGILQSF